MDKKCLKNKQTTPDSTKKNLWVFLPEPECEHAISIGSEMQVTGGDTLFKQSKP